MVAEELAAAADDHPIPEYVEELRIAARVGLSALETPCDRALYLMGRRDGLGAALREIRGW